MRKFLCVFVLLISCTLNARHPDEILKTSQGRQIDRITNNDVNFQLPRFIFNYTNTRVVVKFINANHSKLRENNYELNFIVNGADQKVVFDANGIGSFYYTFKNNNTLQILLEDLNYKVQPSVISIWYIISPLLAMLLFFIYRIATSIKKNKTPKLVVERNIINTDDVRTFTSTLKVVRVKELEEQF